MRYLNSLSRPMGIGLCILALMSVASANEMFYVDPVSGRDNWSGRIASPNSNKTDGPKKTLVGARDAIRTLRFQHWGGNGNYFSTTAPIAEVVLANGSYKMYTPLELTNWESRTIWRAANPGGAVLDGSVELRQRVTPPRYPSKLLLSKSNGVQLLAFSMSGAPTEILAHPGSSGFSIATSFNHSTPIVNGKSMKLAQYPNNGWLTIPSVPNQNGKSFQSGIPGVTSTFKTPGAMVQGYLAYNWTYSTIPIASLPSDGTVNLTTGSFLGQRTGQRYRFVNVFEELDSPGEYYIDPQRRILYLGVDRLGYGTTRNVHMPVNNDRFVDLYQCQNVTLDGLAFFAGRNNAITMTESRDVNIRRSKFSHLMNTAITIGNSTNCGVSSSDFEDLGSHAILLNGGNRNTLTGAGNYARNNHLMRFSQWYRSGRPGIDVMGVGQIVANNRLEQAPQGGVYVSGNNHLVEKNEFIQLCQEAGDSGVLYSGGDVTARGNVFRNNIFVDIQPTAPNPYTVGMFDDVSAIYLDDCASGYEVYGNVFHRVSIGVHVHGGSDNKIHDNIGSSCSTFLRFSDGVAQDHWHNQFWPQLQQYNVTQAPYSTAYPELAFMTDISAIRGKRNVLQRNVQVDGSPIMVSYFMTVLNALGAVNPADQGRVNATNSFVNYTAGFMNPQVLDFRVKSNSQLANVGFQAPDTGSVGLVLDQYRSVAPSFARDLQVGIVNP